MQHVSIDNLGWVPKSPVLMSSLNRAHTYATQQQHRQLTLDHLLLALTEDSDALVVLNAGNIDIEKLRSAISDLVGRNEDRTILPDMAGPAASSELVTIFEYASAAADQSGRATIDGAIVLAALIGEGNSSAARLLETHGLTFEHAITSLQNMAASQQTAPQTEEAEEPETAAPKAKNAPVKDSSRLVDPAPPPPPIVPIPAPEKSTFDSARLAKPSATVIPPLAPPIRQNPVAAPPAAEPPASDIPPSFGTGGQTRTPPPAPPYAAPAPPPAAPPGTPRRCINENIGAPGPASRSTRRIREAAPAPAPAAPASAPSQAEDGRIAPWPDPATAAPPPPSGRPRVIDDGGMRGGGEPPPPRSRSYSSQQVRRRSMDPGGARGAGAVNSADAEHSTRPPQSSTPLSPMVGEGQLIENIPRKMRVGIPEQIEVRIARNSVNVPTGNMQGRGAPQSYDMYVTKAMTVRLRAPEGGVRIETSSPETQWIDNALGLIHDDFASWRWTVTPDKRGITKLQLVVSARTVGSDGVAAETALPDQLFDIVIRMNYVRTAKQLGGWAAAAVAGGIITAFGADAYSKILALVDLL